MKRAFGIIEVLIASSIIASVLGGLVYVGRLALTSSTNTKVRSEALGLATEGLEIVRHIRDSNWADSDNSTVWNSLVMENDGTFSTVVPDSGKSYIVKFNKAKNGQDRFGLDYGNAEQISSPDGSTFFRSIDITSTGVLLPATDDKDSLKEQSVKRDNAMKITVTVTWDDNKAVSVSELLTNWRPNY